MKHLAWKLEKPITCGISDLEIELLCKQICNGNTSDLAEKILPRDTTQHAYACLLMLEIL